MSEQGERLNIRKATLRDWRRKFAQRLREQGLEATATERALQGASSRLGQTDSSFQRATARFFIGRIAIPRQSRSMIESGGAEHN